ncbi:tetratricopeptide repeat protein [uncultured Methanomethylovorans sp.]|uniref:tetratricopeptide repeat protein n=1 Tax=uncultured Methanomethylovorans sp. TaxID=183759 RepID=UPI0037480A1A
MDTDPYNAEAWNNKGNALADLGGKEEAITCYNKALKINPKSENAWNLKSNAMV